MGQHALYSLLAHSDVSLFQRQAANFPALSEVGAPQGTRAKPSNFQWCKPAALSLKPLGVDEFLDFRRQEGISGYVVGLSEVYLRFIFRDMGADLRDSPEVPRDQSGTSSAKK